MTSRIRAEWHRGRIRYNVWRMSFPLHVRRRSRRLVNGTVLLVVLASNLTFISFLNFSDKASALSAGPEEVSASGDCVEDTSAAGTVSWGATQGNAFSNNATYASASVDGTATEYIKCTNYGFSIPSSAIVTGIVVTVERKGSGTACSDAAMRIVKGGTIGTTDRSTATAYTTSDVAEDHGGSTDLWGETWTPTDINASTFGAAFSAEKASGGGAAQTVTVDVITVTVHYDVYSDVNQSSYRWFNNADSTGYDSFVTTEGGSASDVAYGVTATADGGYVVVGLTTSYTAGLNDALITKYNVAGGEEWTKTIGGTSDDYAMAVTELSDGSIIVGGYGASTGFTAGSNDFYLIKLNSSGVEQWTQSLGGAGSDIVTSVTATSDGGFILSGYSATYGTGDNDALIAKFDSSGTEQWSTTIQGAAATNTIARRAIETTSGPIIVVGYTNAYGAGDYDVFLSSLNPTTGDEIWTKTMGGTGIDYGHNVIEAEDGSLMVTGRTTSYSAGDNDLFLTKFDFAGDVVWTKTIGGAGFEVGLSLRETDNNQFVVAGYAASYSASEDMLITRFDAAGDEVWTTTVGGSGVDWGWSMDKMVAGGFIVAGKSASYGAGGDDILISRFTDSGTIANCTTICASQTVTSQTRSTSSVAQSITPVLQALTQTSRTVTETDRSPQLLVTCGSVDLYYGYVVGGTAADVGRSIAVDGSGNYVVVGQEASFGATGIDVMIVKYNAAGAEQWSATWGGSSTATEVAYGVVVDGNGDYVITGHTLSFTTPASIFITKFNSSGTHQWSSTIGGASGDFANGLVVDASNNYYVYGEGQSYGGGDEIILSKFDVNGVEQWTQTLGTAAQDLARGGVIDGSGNIYLTGQTASAGGGGLDAFVSKFNSSGVEQWSVTWGGAGNDYGYDIDLDSAGNIGITGFTASYGTANNTYIAVFNSSGTEQWSAHIGGANGEYGNAIIADSDDNWVTVGEVESFGAGGDDAYISKYTNSGKYLYTQTYGGTGGDLVRDIVQDSQGFYVLPGEFDTFGAGLDDFSLLKVSPDGNQCSSICQLPSAATSTAISITQGTWTVTETAQTITETARTPTVSDVTSSTTETPIFEILEIPLADVGTALNSVAQNTSTTAATEGTAFRLRLAMHISGVDGLIGDLTFKLQYAEKVGTCDTSFTGEVFADVSTSTPISYYVANDIPDGSPLVSNANDPTHSTDAVILQEYVSANNFGIKSSVAVGEDGLWDFALYDNGAPANTAYCFRVVSSSGTQLNTYTVVPEITIADADFEMAGYRWFQDEYGAGNTTFVQDLGGTGTELGRAIVQNDDGSFVTAGYSSTTGVAGASDAMLTKWDAYGEEVWTKVLGGTGDEIVIGLVTTSDGGYVVGGYSASYGTGGDLMLTKFDGNGAEVWTKTAGGGGLDYIRDLKATADGGFIGAGYTLSAGAGNADVMTVKFTSAGEISWTSVIGRLGNDYGERVIETAGGDFIITGNTQSTDMTVGGASADLWIVKLNSSGVEQWTKTLGGTGFDIGQDVIETSGGDFIVVGNADSYAALGAEHTITKFNSSGVEQWTKYWGGSGTDRAQAVVEVSDGYVVTGYGNTAGGGNQDLVLTKFNTSGQLVWARTVGGSTDDWGLDVIETLDGGIAALGYGTSYGTGADADNLFWAKFTSDGDINDCTDCRVYYVAESTATVTETDRTATTDNATDPAWSMTDRTSSTTLTDFTSTLANDFVCGEGTTFSTTPDTIAGDKLYAVANTADGGYVAAGKLVASTIDAYIAKYDDEGNIEWTTATGSASNDYFNSVIQTSDGGYLAAGYTNGYGAGSQDGYLVKYTSTGSVEWSRTAGSASLEFFQSVIQTSDGGYLAAGYTNGYGAGVYDGYLVKYNSSGTIEWSRTAGGTGNDYFYSVIQTYDGGYLAGGRTASFGAGNEDGYLVKYNSSGTIEWSRTAGGASSDVFYSAIQTYDGGYIAAGSTVSFGVGSADGYVVKYNSSGTIEWSRTASGGSNSSPDVFYEIIQTQDGGYVAAGATDGNDGTGSNDDGYLVKYDASGTVTWSHTFDMLTTNMVAYEDIVPSTDGGFMVVGSYVDSGGGADTAIVNKIDGAGLIGGCSTNCASPTSSVTSPTSTANSPTSTANSPTSTANSPSSANAYQTSSSTFTVALNYWMADGIIATVSTPLANLNTATTLTRADTPLRLRALIHTTTKTPLAGSKYFKLQYSVKSGTCDTSFTGESYSDVTKLSTLRGYNSRSLINGAPLATSANDPTNGGNPILYQNYNGSGSFSSSSAMTRGASSLWDIGLTPYEAPDNSYCVRIVKGDGSVLDTTTYVAEVTVPIPSVQQMRHGQGFSSTNPGVKTGFYW